MRALPELESKPPSERILGALALPLTAAVRLTLWLLPSHLIVRLTRRLAEGPEREVTNRPSLNAIVRAVTTAAHHVPQATCLTQAVTVQLLLHHYGYGSTLCVGVAVENDGAFRAHAWVEHRDCIVVGGEGSRSLVRLDLKAASVAGVHT